MLKIDICLFSWVSQILYMYITGICFCDKVYLLLLIIVITQGIQVNSVEYLSVDCDHFCFQRKINEQFLVSFSSTIIFCSKSCMACLIFNPQHFEFPKTIFVIRNQMTRTYSARDQFIQCYDFSSRRTRTLFERCLCKKEICRYFILQENYRRREWYYMYHTMHFAFKFEF